MWGEGEVDGYGNGMVMVLGVCFLLLCAFEGAEVVWEMKYVCVNSGVGSLDETADLNLSTRKSSLKAATPAVRSRRKRENHYHSAGCLGTVPTVPVSIMPLFNRNPLYQDLYNQGYHHHSSNHQPTASPQPALHQQTSGISHLNAQTENPTACTP